MILPSSNEVEISISQSFKLLVSIVIEYIPSPNPSSIHVVDHELVNNRSSVRAIITLSPIA